MSFVFNIPPAVVTGGGSSQDLVTAVGRLGGTRALIVTDDFMVKSGVIAPFLSLLAAGDIPAAVFSGVLPDPSGVNVIDGLAALRASSSDVIVTIGGGSPIDCAKAIGVLATNGGKV